MKNDPSRPLNILFLDSDMVWRGGQEQLLTLMQGLKARGHQVMVATPTHSALSQKGQQSNIPTLPFNQRIEFSPLALGQLWRILHKRDFDVIHSNTPRVILAAGLASKLCRVPVRVSSRRVNFPLRSPLSRLKYNWAQEKIVTVSASVRETLLRGGVHPERIRVIYEGVDVKWIDLQKPSSVTTRNGLVVGTVAHMSPEKGHDILLQAASEIVLQFPHVTFVLVGDGKLASKLARRTTQLGIEDNVIFTGFRSDIEALVKNFDIFCLPSLSEGLSSAILIAMANRLPVVATTVGGIPELVIDGQTGLLVSPDHPGNLASALLKLIRSAPLRQQMGDAARRRVEESFTLERKLDQTERLYRQLLASTDFG